MAYFVTVERNYLGSGKLTTHEFKGRSAARKSRECYSSYLALTAAGDNIALIEWWHQDNRLGISERVDGWERP
jgi:hypothetical protein